MAVDQRSTHSGNRYLLVTADADVVRARLRQEESAPRLDFVELAQALDAGILSFGDVARGSPFCRLLARTAGPAVALAWLAFQRRGSFYFVTAENTALPLALLLTFRRGVTLALIGHRLTTPRKAHFMRILRLHRRISMLFCYSRAQETFAITRLGLPRERVQQIAFQVDERFFTPGEALVQPRGVVSVGRELRDYPTLFEALGGTEIPVTVVASSPWSKRADQTAGRSLPPNVTLRKGLTSVELRDLYRQAAVVVVPLQNVDWPAGVTSLFEAQACGRPVVISASDGIRDSLDPDAAVLVPCGDAPALRAAVRRLLQHPDEAAAIGRAGRESVVRARTLDLYVTRIRAGCGLAEKREHP
jgi:glycosyltransferase involved in cell wall biosynthesis